jgi:hypothetical protein
MGESKKRHWWHKSLLVAVGMWTITAGPALLLPQLRWRETFIGLAAAAWLLVCTLTALGMDDRSP